MNIITNLSTICGPERDNIPRCSRTPKNIGMGMSIIIGARKMDRPETEGELKIVKITVH